MRPQKSDQDTEAPLLCGDKATSSAVQYGTMMHRQQHSTTPAEPLCGVSLASACLVVLTECMLSTIVAPFLPKYLHQSLSATPTQVGIVFALYPLAMVTCSAVLGVISARIPGGHWTMLYVGEGLLCLFTVGFAFAQSLPVMYAFRAASGLAGAAAMTSNLSLLTLRFEHRLGAVMGVVEVMSGLGYVVGPPLGGALYLLLSFRSIFLLLAALIGATLLVLLVSWGCPKTGSHGVVFETDTSRSAPSEQHVQTVSPKVSLWSRDIGVTCSAVFLQMCALSFLQPVFAEFLSAHYGLSSFWAGVVFAVPAVLYALMAPLVGRYVDADVDDYVDKGVEDQDDDENQRAIAPHSRHVQASSVSPIFAPVPAVASPLRTHSHSSSRKAPDRTGTRVITVKRDDETTSTENEQTDSSSQRQRRVHFITGGCALAGLGLLFVGPLPFIHVHSLVLMLVALCVLAAGFSLTMIPALPHMTLTDDSLTPQGSSASPSLHLRERRGFAAGLFNSTAAGGTVVGPLLSGVLTEHVGFAWGATGMAGALLLLAPALLLASHQQGREPQTNTPTAKQRGVEE